MTLFMIDIKDIKNYDPRKVSDEILRDDWRIVVAWWARILEEKDFVHSKEEVLNLAFLIYNEMKDRGFKIDPESEAGKNLVEIIESGAIVDDQAMYIVPNHAQLIAEGKKTLLVKSKPYNIAGESFVLITKEEGKDRGLALGRVLLGEMQEISIKEFEELHDKHLISKEERLEWWPNKKKLYSWPIVEFKPYKEPRAIRWIPGTQTFGKVKFIDSDLAPVNPSGFQGTGDRIYLKDVLPKFKSFYTKMPLVYLVGGICNHPVEGTTGDIDILIDKTHVPDDDLALEFRLYRQFDKSLWTRLHFLYDQKHRGPFTNHVPLYNLLLERTAITDVVNMSAMDQLRNASAEIEQMASKSKEEDAIVPFRFFIQPKPVHGRQRDEIYSWDSIKAVLQELTPWKESLDSGIYVEKKYDGMRAQAHKVGKKIRIWSEDGEDVTDMVPEIRDDLLSIPQDFVCEFEIELYVDGIHQNRADTAGVVHSKSLEQTPLLHATVYDCMWWEGKDVHKEPFKDRIPYINSIKKGKRIRPSERVLAKGLEEIRKAIREAASEPGSEGAMLKLPSYQYELDGKTFAMMKYKNEFKISAEVLKRNLVKGQTDVFYYHMGVKRKDGSIAYCGKTFNTKIKADPGDRLEVVFVDLNLYSDPETELEWFNWWAPRVVGKTSKPTTTAAEARKIVLKTSGQIGVKREPSVDEGFEDADIFLQYPPESKKYRGVVHYHQRGRSVHLDWRIQLTDDLLIGFTLFVPKGTSRDATSLSDAKHLYETEIKPIIEEKLKTPTLNFNCSKKAPEPIEWLTFEGEAKPGQIGATRFEYGWFVIIDSFDVEYGAQKSWFHEYFVKNAKLFDGRIVFRLLENKAQWKKTPEGTFTWMMNKAKMNPYVLSKRAVDLKWMPPKDVSALPAATRKEVPVQYRYWNVKTASEARKLRDDLVAEKIIQKADEEEGVSGEFVLQYQTWKGQIVIRGGPSREEWHLLIKTPEGVVDVLTLNDPTGPTTATFAPNAAKRWKLTEGSVEPQTLFNPTKDTPSNVEVLDTGKALVLIDDVDIKKYKLSGKIMKGSFLMEREQKGSAIWSLSPTESAPT